MQIFLGLICAISLGRYFTHALYRVTESFLIQIEYENDPGTYHEICIRGFYKLIYVFEEPREKICNHLYFNKFTHRKKSLWGLTDDAKVHYKVYDHEVAPDRIAQFLGLVRLNEFDKTADKHYIYIANSKQSDLRFAPYFSVTYYLCNYTWNKKPVKIILNIRDVIARKARKCENVRFKLTRSPEPQRDIESGTSDGASSSHIGAISKNYPFHSRVAFRLGHTRAMMDDEHSSSSDSSSEDSASESRTKIRWSFDSHCSDATTASEDDHSLYLTRKRARTPSFSSVEDKEEPLEVDLSHEMNMLHVSRLSARSKEKRFKYDLGGPSSEDGSKSPTNFEHSHTGIPVDESQPQPSTSHMNEPANHPSTSGIKRKKNFSDEANPKRRATSHVTDHEELD